MPTTFSPDQVTLCEVAPTRVAMCEHRGDPGTIDATIQRFIAWRKAAGLSPKTSPTFNIFTLHRGPTVLLHLDAYRLDHPRQVEDLLLADFMISPWCLAVEWPEKIEGWLPPNALDLDLGITPDERHTIRLRKSVAWGAPTN